MRVDIVGAGPAGLGLAIQLLHGANGSSPNVHIWERAPAPHSTPCGEGILDTHLALIPGVDHGHHVRSRIRQVRVDGPAPPTLILRCRASVLNREAWIPALAHKAQNLGATIHWSKGVSAAGVAHLPGDVVVGADGPSSRVAQFLHAPRQMVPALQAHVNAPAQDPASLTFVWRPDEGMEYGWVFPRGDGASVGLLGPHGPENRRRVLTLAKRQGLDASGASFQAWPIPVGGRLVQRGRYCLVGDAAGAANPLTKAGIAPGLLQASMLARLILEGRADQFQRRFRTSMLWPARAEAAWDALRRRGPEMWKRAPWPSRSALALTGGAVRRLALATILRNGFRPGLVRDYARVAVGLRDAVRYGW
ncbi:MAG: NAD(P)/FAD-dependent oxidoreductase [Euryarchaeota archaeon]|nr:NAD(P)/FAD-dependent oxidoreductase [Euryarchaeota archaeon]